LTALCQNGRAVFVRVCSGTPVTTGQHGTGVASGAGCRTLLQLFCQCFVPSPLDAAVSLPPSPSSSPNCRFAHC
ncbi:hypothetical protein J6590_107817, partial [Homalodisca vitripennis]